MELNNDEVDINGVNTNGVNNNEVIKGNNDI